jgi:hypothetical protein
MAQGTDKPGGEVTEAASLRADMARTRAALTRKLGALKERILGPDSAPKEEGRRAMATKRRRTTKSKSAGRGKSAASAKTAKRTTAKKKPPKGKTASRRRTARGRKSAVQKVLGDMLTGAAAGAVRGAAEAVLPPDRRGNKTGEASDQR